MLKDGLAVRKGSFLTLSIPSLRSADPGSRRPGSGGYALVAAAPLGICFGSPASEARRGGGDQRGDWTGRTGLVASVRIGVWCVYFHVH